MHRLNELRIMSGDAIEGPRVPDLILATGWSAPTDTTSGYLYPTVEDAFNRSFTSVANHSRQLQ